MRPTIPVILAFLTVSLLGETLGHANADDDAIVRAAVTRLEAVYATSPQGYPADRQLARPDRSVAFRWHFYRDGAVARHENVPMDVHSDPWNPLEGEGVRVPRDSAVTWEFVAERATKGKRSLRVVFPAQAIADGRATFLLDAVAGGPSFSQYLFRRGLLATGAAYGPHYRWIQLDAFNPAASDVRARVAGVPFVVPPGASTIAVRTADAVDRGYACGFNSIPVQVVGPVADTTLFLDHVRMEQELPPTLRRRGRMFQFAARAEPADPPVVWPGFTPVLSETLYTAERGFGWTKPATTRQSVGHSFRSYENGLLWGRCQRIDSPFRIDLPDGEYLLWTLAAPGYGFSWSKGAKVKVSGREAVLIPPRSDDEVRRTALSGELWDFRPGQCVWEQLVRPVYYPPTEIVAGTARNGQLVIELQDDVSLHALAVFPAADRDAALAELGRLNFLIAESWDVSHPWVKRDYADKVKYIGRHAEMQRPESIPERLRALPLTPADVRRGFLLFHRGLTDPVYPDTIPTPTEATRVELSCFAVPGQTECVTLGLLPLAKREGLSIRVRDLVRTGDAEVRIPADRIDVRISRQHQKTMQFGHHNHDYNYEEHYLVRRESFDLHPGAVRRAYFDVPVPGDAKPGRYAGRVDVLAATGEVLAAVPLTIDVLPLALVEPTVLFASSLDDPRLMAWGFNAFHASYDRAVERGYKAYLANLGHLPVEFKGRKFGWGSFRDERDLLQPLLDAGARGAGPRGYFGGPAPNTHGSPNAAEISDRFFADIRNQFPGIDLPGRTFPAFHFRAGKNGFQTPHEWIVLAGPSQPDDPVRLDEAAHSGRPFWYIDGLRHSKEHAARFTFGFWLWRLGATGRFTSLAAHLQYGGGTARETFAIDPYFTLLDVTTCNVDRALMPALSGGINPCRDLVLLRAGIDDYRYVATLEAALRDHGTRRPGAAEEARRFLAGLREQISTDLAVYYEARSGAYGENWFSRPANPWSAEKLDATRRRAAELVAELTAS